MEAAVVQNGDRIWVKNGQIHFANRMYDTKNLQEIVVQVSDLTFVEDTVRLLLIFDNGAFIVPSMHPSYDGLFEKINRLVKIDSAAYLRAMNCDIDCEFVIFDKTA